MPSITIRPALLASLLLPFHAGAELISHWKFDGSPDDERAANHAVWNGAGTYALGAMAPISHVAAELDGTWLKAGHGFDPDTSRAFSVSVWVRGHPQDAAIIGDMTHGEIKRGWELHTGTTAHGGDAIGVSVILAADHPARAIQVNSDFPVLDGTWHHVAFTYDGSGSAGGVRIHIDGIEAYSMTELDGLDGSFSNGVDAELNIGTRMNGAAHTFRGSIDEVAVFDHVLDDAEISDIHTLGIGPRIVPGIGSTAPEDGDVVNELVSATVTFSHAVFGIDAHDLLVNGQAATYLERLDDRSFRFHFPEPAAGGVFFTWAWWHGIIGPNAVTAEPAGWTVHFTPPPTPPEAAIARFLARNAGGLEDENHDTPDWIELTNPGKTAVDLGGWSLSDDPALPRRWIIPSFVLQPGEKRTIFASGKNRTDPAGNLHTNFKLDAAGGHLLLADPSGAVFHAYGNYPAQEANVPFGLRSGGKIAEGRPGWRYLPTSALPGGQPGAAIMEMKHLPAVPQPGEPVVVTLRIAPETPPDSPPTLEYRIMHGLSEWIAFADDGQHGDGAADDGVWGAIIPGAAAGEMIRWRATVLSDGIESRLPVNRSSASLPQYLGTVALGTSAGEDLPVYRFFVSGYRFPTGINQSGVDSDTGGRGAFFANGRLYDNVLIRIKGTTSRHLFKRSHRVDFNPGHEFAWSPDLPPQRELNLNSEYVDPSYLRQNHQLWMHRESGKAGSPHFPVRLLMNDATWQLAFHTYPADSELMETMGLDPRGAIYKQVWTLAQNESFEKKSRRWEDARDLIDFRNRISASATPLSKSLYIHDNLNLPATINYLAVARIAQEADDVWANMVMYRDSEGTREWRPIPFDLNLSFGQIYYGNSAINTVVQADNDANKSHPLYGSSSCLPNTGSTSSWNRLYDVIIQNPATRAMLLRRIRTLMDRHLAAGAEDSPLESRFVTMAALIAPHAEADRARWGWPPNAGPYGLGPGISPAQGLDTLRSSFLAIRRTHLYSTHSIHNPGRETGLGNAHKAGIPDPQPAVPSVVFGTVEAHPESGNQGHEYVELINTETEAIDVSDWVLQGAGVSFTMKGGTVIPAGASLHVAPSVVSFRDRPTSPRGNEQRFVTGPFKGGLSDYGGTLTLRDGAGTTIAQTTVAPDPAATPASLAVTEILSSSRHASPAINGDWWELTNTGGGPIDLSGFSWDDSRALPGQAVFPHVVLGTGESLIVLDEDDADQAALFRAVWSMPDSVRVLTRGDFDLPDGFRGLGNGDSVVVFHPDGSVVARADYPTHQAGISRAWFRNGQTVPGGFSQAGKFAASTSTVTSSDLGSPGFAAADPSTLTLPYEIWAAANDLWAAAAEEEADPDGDGRSNREEYAFGGQPGVADTAPAASVGGSAGEIRWTFIHRSDDPSLSIRVETSVDLQEWSGMEAVPEHREAHPDLPGYARVTYRFAPDVSARFFRARAE